MTLTTRTVRPHEFHALTGLSPSQVRALLEQVSETLPTSRGRRWHLALSDRILLVLTALRTNLTERQLGCCSGFRSLRPIGSSGI